MTGATPYLFCLFELARRAGLDQRVRHGAALEMASLMARAALADRRKLETLERGLAIAQLQCHGLERAEILERLGLSAQQYQRAVEAHRDSRCLDAVQALQITEE